MGREEVEVESLQGVGEVLTSMCQNAANEFGLSLEKSLAKSRAGYLTRRGGVARSRPSWWRTQGLEQCGLDRSGPFLCFERVLDFRTFVLGI